MTIKKLRDDFIQIQTTDGVLFGVKFKDKDFMNPEKFLAHFKNTNSEAEVIEQSEYIVLNCFLHNKKLNLFLKCDMCYAVS